MDTKTDLDLIYSALREQDACRRAENLLKFVLMDLYRFADKEVLRIIGRAPTEQELQSLVCTAARAIQDHLVHNIGGPAITADLRKAESDTRRGMR